MPTDVIMPQMGESIFEGTLTKWLKKPGDKVNRDEPLFEISTDKVDAEIPSPTSGVLIEQKVAEGTTVQVNTIVGVIGDAGSAVAAAPAPAKPAPAPAKPAAAPAKAAAPAPPSPPAPAPASTPSKGNSMATDVIMPQMGESIFEGTLTKWLKKPGDKVNRDEPLFEISTDKVDAEIPSPISGVLLEQKVAEGTTVQVNTVVGIIGGEGGAVAAAPAAAPAKAAAPAPAPATAPARPAAPAPAVQAAATGAGTSNAARDIKSSPLVRKIAKDKNINLHQVSGTGMGGRITKDDILNFINTHGAGAAAPAAARPGAAAAAPGVSRPTAPAMPVSTVAPGELVPMSKIRSIIAHRMVESKQTSAHVHTVFKVDMTRIVKVREKQRKSFEERNGVKLTYMPFVARAVMAGIKAMPIVNSSVVGEAIQYHKSVNIGIAVALDWGLIVPVVKQAEDRSFVGLAKAIVDVAERARGKKLQPDEIQGGTFTITNPGAFGPQFGTPIINQPQVAILGMGGLFKEPVVITDDAGNDSIAIRSIIRLTLGYDHRIIDGADADRFMVVVRDYLENWNEEIG